METPLLLPLLLVVLVADELVEGRVLLLPGLELKGLVLSLSLSRRGLPLRREDAVAVADPRSLFTLSFFLLLEDMGLVGASNGGPPATAAVAEGFVSGAGPPWPGMMGAVTSATAKDTSIREWK